LRGSNPLRSVGNWTSRRGISVFSCIGRAIACGRQQMRICV
jgi:hypothetical protein